MDCIVHGAPKSWTRLGDAHSQWSLQLHLLLAGASGTSPATLSFSLPVYNHGYRQQWPLCLAHEAWCGALSWTYDLSPTCFQAGLGPYLGAPPTVPPAPEPWTTGAR